MKLGLFSTVPNYFALLAFGNPDFGGRISVLLTLVLALTAVLFVLQNMLPMTPKVSYTPTPTTINIRCNSVHNGAPFLPLLLLFPHGR